MAGPITPERRAIALSMVRGELAPEDATLHVRLAEMLLAANQLDEDLRHLEQALDFDPKLPTPWATRGRMMRATGRPQEALADFHRALNYPPDDRQVLLELAEVHQQLNQPRRALQTLQLLSDAYSPGEEPAELLTRLGAAYVAVGRYDDATRSLAAAVQREPPSADALFHLGEAELLAGRPGAAVAAAQQALQLEPTHQASHQLLQRIELARRPRRAPQR